MNRDKNNNLGEWPESALVVANKEVALYRSLYAKRPEAFAAILAMSLNNLGINLSSLGRREEALHTTGEAVALYHGLHAKRPEAFAANLAMSLNNLGINFSLLGRREEALQAAEEAVELYRGLHAHRPEAFAANLAGSLSNLGNWFSALYRGLHAKRPEAFAANLAGSLSNLGNWFSALYRSLHAKRPEAFATDLASSLNNLGSVLSALGWREEALQAAEEAVELHRGLHAKRPEAFAANLAGSLCNLGNRFGELGRREEALQAAEEAVELRRGLHSTRPEAFAADLAISLNNLGNWFSALGRSEEAHHATGEAVALYRGLHATRPEAFAADLATSLHNLGNRFSALGRRGEALQAAEEAVKLRRSLHAKRPGAFASDLASSLNNLGNWFSKLGRREEALQAAEEAVELYRNLHVAWPEAFAADLAGSLSNLSNSFSALCRREEALQATGEAVELCRSLHAKRPEAFAVDLASSLNNMGNWFSALGRREEAHHATGEAVALYRGLHATWPETFAADLASSLNNLGINLSSLGRREEALQAAEEALALYRGLHARRPEAFAADLATSLNNLGAMFSKLGRREEAFQAAEEALELRRGLCSTRPEAFATNLAISLNNLGAMFSELGRHEEALRAAEEAVALHRSLHAKRPEAFAADLATSLSNLGNWFSAMGQWGEVEAVLHEAGLCLLSQRTMDPHHWCESVTRIAPHLDSAVSLRQIHLAAIERIADLRRLSYFDSAAGGEFIKLQVVLVADLWRKLAGVDDADPQLMDDTLAALVSAMQSPDLMRWLVDNNRSSPEGKALARAEDEMRQAQATLSALIERLRGGRDDQDSPIMGTRRAPTAEQQAADEANIAAAEEREVASRVSLENARKALAEKDPAFASAYEVPPVSELRAMLEHLRVVAAPPDATQVAPAALLCFLELAANGEDSARLVGVLLSSGSAQVRQLEFPGLLELAQKFQQYKPSGQRSGAPLRWLRDDSDVDAKKSDAPATLDFDGLFNELEQLWWAPLKNALGAELVRLGTLHICSHGIAHQLPYSKVSYLDVGGNLQLFQWPGLPYLRLAYSQGRTRSSTNSSGEGWQIAHDCAWNEPTPLPMVAVEAHLLLGIVRDAGQLAESVDDPAHVLTSGRGLVVCSHGTKAQGVHSAVHLSKGKLTTGEVMRRKIAPEIALIPACHAADTADDHAHNALGVAAGFLLAGSKVVVGSIKAVPDTLMPWFSTLLVWYVAHEKLGLHAAAVRARQDFGKGEFPSDFQAWVCANLADGLATLHPDAQEEQRLNATLPQAALVSTINAWPWFGMNRDALVPKNPVNLADMREASRKLASNAFKPTRRANVAEQMKEMAAFLVVFGLG